MPREYESLEVREADTKCNARTRSSPPNYCKNPAGYKTDHSGSGRCYLHGGCTPGRPPSPATIVKRKLRERAQELATSPELLDLRPQLGLLLASLESYTERIENSDEHVRTGELEAVTSTIDAAGKLVERIERIYASKAPSHAELKAFYHHCAAVFARYVPREQLEQALAELAGERPRTQPGVLRLPEKLDSANTRETQPEYSETIPPARVPLRKSELVGGTHPTTPDSNSGEKVGSVVPKKVRRPAPKLFLGIDLSKKGVKADPLDSAFDEEVFVEGEVEEG